MPRPRRSPTPKATQLRGERLIECVLGIALQELARVDYESLSFELIAERAGVNKVTLYRRWPTKRDLIQAALERLSDQVPVPVDTGALRSDLQLYLRSLADFMSRADTRAAFHTLFVTDTQLRELAIAVRRDKEAQADRVIARAIGRGELPEQVDRALFQSLLVGVVADRVVLMRETLSDETIGRIIDIVVHGATTAHAATERPGKPARKHSPKRSREAHVPSRSPRGEGTRSERVLSPRKHFSRSDSSR